jgi:hypothetical protein
MEFQYGTVRGKGRSVFRFKQKPFFDSSGRYVLYFVDAVIVNLLLLCTVLTSNPRFGLHSTDGKQSENSRNPGNSELVQNLRPTFGVAHTLC